MHNWSFPVDTQIRFELIAKKVKFVVHCFVDIVLVQIVMIIFTTCFMAIDVYLAKSLQGIKKAPSRRASTISQNSQDDSVRSLLFLESE
jgi:hypothetical protein